LFNNCASGASDRPRNASRYFYAVGKEIDKASDKVRRKYGSV